MQKNGGPYVVSANFNKLFISIVLVNLFYLGFVYLLPESDLVYSAIEANSKFNNYSSYNTNFQANQTYTSELFIDSYYQVKIGDTIDLIMISSPGNKISALNYDDDENSIILLLNPSDAEGNNILIDIPRNILDSKINGNDNNFTVMVDDQPAKFLEISNDSELNSISSSRIDNTSEIQYSNNADTRKLMIEYGADSKIIKISGTDTSNLNKTGISIMKDNSQLYLPIKTNNTMEYLPLELRGGLLYGSELVINSERNKTLFLSILPHSNNGNILIDIPRNILDSKINGNDNNFTVMVDDQPAKFLEISNDSELNSISSSRIDNTSEIQYSNNADTRKLMIEYGADSKIIKISGTDTSNLNDQSKGLTIPGNQTTQEKDDQQDIFFPVLFIIVVVGIAILYVLHRKNKIQILRKTKLK